ncbi:MAG: helix-turn-helix transcriptional regulator [Methylocella sp.]
MGVEQVAQRKSNDAPLLFSVPETCSKLGIKQNSLYNLVATGKIQPVKIGARTLFLSDEISRFVDGLKEDRRVKRLAKQLDATA